MISKPLNGVNLKPSEAQTIIPTIIATQITMYSQLQSLHHICQNVDKQSVATTRFQE